jgi:hypothetical protein
MNAIKDVLKISALAGGKIIENGDLMIPLEKLVDNIRADKARTACHQIFHSSFILVLSSVDCRAIAYISSSTLS